MPYLESALVTTAAAGATAEGKPVFIFTLVEPVTQSSKLGVRQMTFLLVLNRGLHIVDSIALRDVKSDGLARKSVDENLHSTTETKNITK